MLRCGLTARLLSCASVIALGGAAVGPASAHPHCAKIAHPTTINWNKDCVTVTKTVAGDVVNNARIGDLHAKRAAFVIGGDGAITGKLVNNGWILGAPDGQGALTLGEDADVEGGIFNNGVIASIKGDGIALGYYEPGRWHHHHYHPGHAHEAALTGDIVNAGLIAGGDNGIAARYGAMSGALVNEASGVILGREAGVLIARTFTAWTGGVDNAGLILGGEQGVRIETATFAGGLLNREGGAIVGLWGDGVYADTAWSGAFDNQGLIAGARNGVTLKGPTFQGSFANSGAIVGRHGDGVAIDVDVWGSAYAPAHIVNTATGVIAGGETGFRLKAGTVYGDFTNDGAIFGGGPDTGLHITADEYFGDITNNGEIGAPSKAVNLEIGLFDGAFANTGAITGGVTGAAMTLGQMTGGFANSGSIVGEYGKGVDIVVTSWGAADARVEILNAETGVIAGGDVGFALEALTLHGDFTNDGAIEGGYLGARLIGGTFDGAFSNTGDITGGVTGAALAFTQMTGDFTNEGSIVGEYGKGADIVVTSWGAADARVEILNAETGVIAGGDVGFALEALALHGDFTNDGAIDGGNLGARLTGGTFDGAFANNGDITGGATGAALNFTHITGGFTNSGSIAGAYGDGVGIDVGVWGAEGAPADIVNTVDGVITGGETGFRLNAGTVYGDFINDGSISGGGPDTGLHITAEEYFGDITNNGAIDAPSKAVNLEIGLLDGAFANTGDIAGGVTGAAMTLGQMTGGFTNEGSISGDAGNGVDIVVATWGAADARVQVLNAETGVITGGDVGFALEITTLHGDVTNDGAIDGGNIGVLITGGAYETLLAGGTFDGAFANNGDITGGATGAALNFTHITGGFTNSGSIVGEYGDGVGIDVGVWGAEGAPADIVNTVDGVITGGETGFRLNAGTVYGDFINDGSISGGGPDTGLHITAEEYFGDITNNGAVDAPSKAVNLEIGLLDGAFANTGDIAGGVTGTAMTLGHMTGGFTNEGSISGDAGNGVDIVVATWGAADARVEILNAETGVITGGDVGFALEITTLHGDFTNDGAIDGGNIGVLISGGAYETLLAGGTFDGAFSNTGDITGGATGVALNLAEVTGGFTNSGSIAGAYGDGVGIDVGVWGAEGAPGDIVNTVDGVITGGETGFRLNAGAVYGDFINDGSISGGGPDTGLHITAEEYFGDVTNNGDIEAPSTAANLEIGLFDGSFVNTDDITGGVTGAAMTLGQMTGDFTNEGSISGETGKGVDIVVTSWGAIEAPVDILNADTGVITGGDVGFALSLVTLHGDLVNDGAIDGGNIGVLIGGGAVETALVADSVFDGSFTNNAHIGGGATGVALNLTQVSGVFTNSGSITGGSGDGVAIDVEAWGAEGASADIVNTASGVISGGDTGFRLEVVTMHGDFINDGSISGGGPETGLHIIAEEFFGDITNTGALDAPSNALHLEIETLGGGVENSGDITAGNLGGVAVALDIGNGATFTNTGGGLILGDVLFGGKAAYDFVGEDGGVEGDLIGEGAEGNDDTITVQDGVHYFVGRAGEGTASNFASFTVEDGGMAVMGARVEGGPSAGGYAFSNVDALNVNSGGTLYIDKATTLNVDESYTQQADGTLEFLLGAPGGEGFSNLTGTIVAGDDDYGQILVNGPATLNGAVVGFLDPAFAAANPNLDAVLYDDVLVAAGGISGDFSTVALIADSSLFELDRTIDGNTLDLRVSRTTLLGGLSGIVVNAGGPFDSMVNDRSNGIGSGSCGLAGPGWCFNRFAANEHPGATQVMTDATPGDDPFAWLRTGVRREGETAVWGRAVGVWGETDGDARAPGSDINVAGAIVGVDHVFTPILMAGLAAQWTTTDVDFAGRPDNAEVDSFEAGVYASYGDTRLYVNANASVIFHNIEVNRFTQTGHAVGDYDGTTLSAFAEAGKIFETEEGMRIQPFVALSYSHLETDAYSETGSGALLDVSGSDFDSLKSMVGARLAYPIQMDSGRKVVPEARIAWAHEFMDNQASHLATVQGQPPAPSLILGEKYSRDTLVVGAGVTVPLSQSSTLFVDYDAGLNPDITTHTLSAGVRFTW